MGYAHGLMCQVLIACGHMGPRPMVTQNNVFFMRNCNANIILNINNQI